MRSWQSRPVLRKLRTRLEEPYLEKEHSRDNPLLEPAVALDPLSFGFRFEPKCHFVSLNRVKTLLRPVEQSIDMPADVGHHILR